MKKIYIYALSIENEKMYCSIITINKGEKIVQSSNLIYKKVVKIK